MSAYFKSLQDLCHMSEQDDHVSVAILALLHEVYRNMYMHVFSILTIVYFFSSDFDFNTPIRLRYCTMKGVDVSVMAILAGAKTLCTA